MHIKVRARARARCGGKRLRRSHFVNQAITRGVGPGVIMDAVRSPLIVLEQSSGNYLFIGSSGVVVLTKDGIGVTTYGAEDYGIDIQGIINRLNGPP